MHSVFHCVTLNLCNWGHCRRARQRCAPPTVWSPPRSGRRTRVRNASQTWTGPWPPRK